MPIVNFNSIDEYCEEIKKDAKFIDRGIVRVTNLFKSSKASPNIEHLSVVSTYSVKNQIVRLECYCGDVWGMPGQDDKRYTAAEEACKKIKETVAMLVGIEIRNGVLDSVV